MNQLISKVKKEFLSDVAIDWVSLGELVGYFEIDYKKIPSIENFDLALKFILYLFNRYNNKFVCLRGPDMKPSNKPPKELVKWLKNEYDKGNYGNIDYGVWFDLDESVIPKKYLLKSVEDGET